MTNDLPTIAFNEFSKRGLEVNFIMVIMQVVLETIVYYNARPSSKIIYRKVNPIKCIIFQMLSLFVG